MISNIRGERSRLDMTQQDLADALHVAKSTVQRWEEGLNKPGTDKVAEMAGIFGCTTDYLLGVTEERL